MRRLLPRRARRLLRRIASSLAPRAGLPLAAAAGVVMRRTGLRAGVAVVYHRLGERPGDPARELNPAVAHDSAGALALRLVRALVRRG